MRGALDALPRLLAANMPVVTREQMREVDRLMIEEFGIQLLQMMENAGLNLAELARSHLDGEPAGRRVVVLAGQGNNGGGGLTASRRLNAWGARVEVVLSVEPSELRDVPALQLRILQQMGVPARCFAGALPPHDILIDAVIGYSLEESPRGRDRWRASRLFGGYCGCRVWHRQLSGVAAPVSERSPSERPRE